MKTYITYFRCILATQVIFRFSFFTEFLAQIVPMLVKIFLWSAIIKNSPNSSSQEINFIITYFIVSFVLIQITEHRLIIADKIRLGTLSAELLKPVSIINLEFTRAAALKIISLVKLIPATILLMYIYHDYVIVPNLDIYSLLFIIISFALFFNIQLFIHNLSFYVIEISGLSYIISVINSLFSGNLIPFSYIPENIRMIFEMLPFKYLVHVPVSSLLGQLPSAIANMFILQAGLYLVLFSLMNVLLFKIGCKKYLAVGG